jgi:hypothetical protein
MKHPKRRHYGFGITPAGQRRDMTRIDNNAAVTLGDNLREAIAWQMEHRQ